MGKSVSQKANRAIQMLQEAQNQSPLSEEIRRRLMMLIGHPAFVRFQVRNVIEDNKSLRTNHFLEPEKQADICGLIESRLNQKPEYYERPLDINPDQVKTALEAHPDLIWSLSRMEETGGRPDIIYFDDRVFIFGDCSAESPVNRRGMNFLKASTMAKDMGVSMMTVEVYKDLLQKLGCFDLHSSSWLAKSEGKREVEKVQVGTTSASSIGLWSALFEVMGSVDEEENIGKNPLAGTSDDETVRIENYDIRSQDPLIGWRGTLVIPR